ncbi:MAG: DUF362 domain-containing protein [Deltaproteobacteria bacterium]|nr:DUF362 domain-containing protein [Deltaproteobacteria bacterium]
MKFDKPITRRESIRNILRWSGYVTLAGAAQWPLYKLSDAWGAATKKRFMVEGFGQTDGFSVKDLTKKVFEAAGGIKRFVSRQDVVAIKPNISWARHPRFAATTHPEVLAAVIELCQEAGAGRVRIVDHTIHDARQCFGLTGAGKVAKETGVDLVYPRSSLIKKMKLRGNRLDVWPVFTPLVEADKVINLPVAKHHSLSTLTLGMKNWIGGVGGSRWSLHQDIHQSIVDLAHFFKPEVTLIDAIRIMTQNGPSGGSTNDVTFKNTLILSDDPVAADARASKLFGLKPQSIGYIHLAQKEGLGTYDLSKLEKKKVIV